MYRSLPAGFPVQQHTPVCNLLLQGDCGRSECSHVIISLHGTSPCDINRLQAILQLVFAGKCGWNMSKIFSVL